MRALITLFFVAACSGGTPSSPDASAMHDAPSGAMCTGLAYDACNPSATNCTTGTSCHFFMSSGFSVCSPSCSASAPCPNQGSTAISCNMMGICKPPAPNADCSAP